MKRARFIEMKKPLTICAILTAILFAGCSMSLYITNPDDPTNSVLSDSYTPSGITVTQGTRDSGVLINWDKIGPATRYVIYRGADATGDFTEVDVTASSSFEDISIDVMTKYHYRVQAVLYTGKASKLSDPVSGYMGGQFTWGPWNLECTLDGDEVTIDNCPTSASGAMSIPETIEGHPVVEIGLNAFRDCTLLTGSVVIPAHVRTLGVNAFRDCTGLNGTLDLTGGSLTYIDGGAFAYCDGLTGNLIIPPGVVYIGLSAFLFCDGFNGTLTLPAGLETIEKQAFYGCNSITGDLNIPSSVSTIGEQAFLNCTGFNGTLTLPDNITRVERQTFNGCTSLTGPLTIPEGVTFIGYFAFNACASLNGDLTLPSTLTHIDEGGIRNCPNMTGDVIIPSGVTTIGSTAFELSSSIETVSVPATVTSIDAGAFKNCTGLTDLYMNPATPPTDGTDAFLNVGNGVGGCTLHVPIGNNNYDSAAEYQVSDGHFSSIVKDL
jgi:hypothetical protein